MITRNIVALKDININTGVEKVSLKKDDIRLVKFRNEAQYLALLSFDNFKAKQNGIPVVKSPKVTSVINNTFKEPVQEVQVETSALDVSEKIDIIKPPVQELENTVDVPICSNCSVPLIKSSTDVETQATLFICPICKMEEQFIVPAAEKDDDQDTNSVPEVVEDTEEAGVEITEEVGVEKTEVAPKKEPKSEPAVEEYACLVPGCGRTYTTERSLKAHMTRVHSK